MLPKIYYRDKLDIYFIYYKNKNINKENKFMAEKLAIMLVSEEYEKSHVASMIASVAAVSGIDVSIFVTGNAVYNFLKKNVEKKNFTGGKLYDLIKEKKATLFYELFDITASLKMKIN